MTKEYFITKVHDLIRSARVTRRHATERAENVPKGLCKEYPRMRQIPLPPPLALGVDLQKTIQARESLMHMGHVRPFRLDELGTLLGGSISALSETRRRYPSGGRLFPVETYLLGKILEKEPPGVFHYHPKKHVLEFLWEGATDMEHIYRRPKAPLPPASMFMTAVWGRGTAKYGDLTYYHSLIEAGHMAQNVLLVGTALGIGMRPHCGFDDTTVASLLDLDTKREQPIYSILLAPYAEHPDTTAI